MAVVFFCCLAAGCDTPQEEPMSVSLETQLQKNTTESVFPDQQIHIAISTVISPKQTYVLYKELLDYMQSELGRPVKLVQRETYGEVNSLIESSELDLAFVCGGAYVQGHADFGMELLVAPVYKGKPLYYSYIIVPASSSISSLEELRGKHFLFTDPLSNSGKISPTFLFTQMGEDIDTFFQSYSYTHRHDLSIEMIANNLADGAAVDSLIWAYMDKNFPEITDKTQIINRSGPYGIPPVVVSGNLSPDLKKKFRNLFLNLHETEKGRQILNKLFIDKFVEVDDSLYDSIREMKQ